MSHRSGPHYRPILESEIKAAQSISLSGAQAAKKLGCSYETYRKYATMYGLYEGLKNKCGAGIVKVYDPSKGKFPIAKILNGDFPNYPTYKIKKKLFRAKIKEEKCESCGYDEKRITDGRPPLLINFLDGNNKNHRLENMKMLCYNCYHNQVGTFAGRKAYFSDK